MKKEIEIIPESLGNVHKEHIVMRNYLSDECLFLRNLAEMLDCYRLSYNVLMSEALRKEFNRAVTLYMENGLEAFYKSYAEFLSNIR